MGPHGGPVQASTRFRSASSGDRDRLLYDRGDLSPEAYWSALAEAAGVQVDARTTRRSSRQWDLEMWAHDQPGHGGVAELLHSSGIKTGAAFEHAARHDPYARQNFAWLNHFDHQTFSAEVGLIKPDAAIYEHSLRGVGVAASEALFVDDKSEMFTGARAVGIHAIRFRSVDQFADDLTKVGFRILPNDVKIKFSGFPAEPAILKETWRSRIG